MLSYLRDSVWDIVLCALASAALSFTVCSGFAATQGVLASWWVFPLVALVLSAVLILIAFNRKTAVIGSVAGVVVLVAALAVAARIGTSPSVLVDQEGNCALAVVLLVAPALLVFALSRKRAGAVVLVVLGVLICLVFQYLYWQSHIAAFVVFIISSAALFMFKSYQHNLFTTKSDDMSLTAVSIAGVVFTAICVALASGLFLAVVAPLNPPQLVVKLISEHVKIQEDHVKGVGDTMEVTNENMFSITVSDQTVETGRMSSEDNAQQNSQDASEESDNVQQNSGSALSLDSHGDEDAGQATTLETPNYTIPIVIAIVVLLVLGAIALKKLLRRRRFRKMAAMEAGAQVQAFFLFFMRRLQRVGLPAVGSLTLHEYAQGQGEAFSHFEGDSGVPAFAVLCDAYARSVYGCGAPSDDDCALFTGYYAQFYRNARRFVGTVKYVLLFFLI